MKSIEFAGRIINLRQLDEEECFPDGRVGRFWVYSIWLGSSPMVAEKNKFATEQGAIEDAKRRISK